MRFATSRLARRGLGIAVVLLACVCAAVAWDWLGNPLANQDTAEAPHAAAAQESGPVGAAGMRVYKDPATGRLGPPPRGAPAPAAPGRAKGRPSRGPLEVRPGRTWAGGTVLEGRGRLWNRIVARKQADGAVETTCESKRASD
jgi:hypothetical protein